MSLLEISSSDDAIRAAAAAYARTVAEAPRRNLLRKKAKIISRARMEMTRTLDP